MMAFEVQKLNFLFSFYFGGWLLIQNLRNKIKQDKSKELSRILNRGLRYKLSVRVLPFGQINWFIRKDRLARLFMQELWSVSWSDCTYVQCLLSIVKNIWWRRKRQSYIKPMKNANYKRCGKKRQTRTLWRQNDVCLKLAILVRTKFTTNKHKMRRLQV